MKFKLSGAAVLAALFVLALFAGMATGGGGTPPGQDPCSHGATGKDCRPDPQPDNGKDCLHHGQQGGVNEDHCLTTTVPTPCAPGEIREGDHCVPPPTMSTPTVTVTTPGQTTTLPGTTTTTPGKTTTVATTTPGSTVTVATPGGTQTVTQNVAGPTVTVTGPTVTAPAQAVSPATATAPRTVTRIRYRIRTRTITHTVIRWKTRTRIVVHHEKCKPHIVTVCPRGMTGKPPRCGAAANG